MRRAQCCVNTVLDSHTGVCWAEHFLLLLLAAFSAALSLPLPSCLASPRTLPAFLLGCAACVKLLVELEAIHTVTI
jgi:hypothetical protein